MANPLAKKRKAQNLLTAKLEIVAGKEQPVLEKEVPEARSCKHPKAAECANFPYLLGGLIDCQRCRYFIKPDNFIEVSE